METLFKMALQRSAGERRDDVPTLDLTQHTEFQENLQKDPNKLKDFAEEFRNSKSFVAQVGDLELSDEVKSFLTVLEELDTANDVTARTVKEAISESFGYPAVEVVKEARYRQDVSNLRDSIIAIKSLPEAHHLPIHKLVSALRALEFVHAIATRKGFSVNRKTLRQFRQQALALPNYMQRKAATTRPQPKAKEEAAKVVQEKVATYKATKAALAELKQLDRRHLVQVPPGKSTNPSSEETPCAQTLAESMEVTQKLIKSEFSKLQQSLKQNGETVASESPSSTKDTAPLSATIPLAPTAVRDINLEADQPEQANFNPTNLGEAGFRVSSQAAASLSKETHAVLGKLSLSLEDMPLDRVVDLLEKDVTQTRLDLEQMDDRPVQKSLQFIGNTPVITKTPLNIDRWVDLRPPFVPFDNRIPKTHGTVEPAGVADLLVVRQQMKGYEDADVAHIENVLKGENKVRNHRRRRETDELIFSEVETTATEERNLESTDRFEMTRETNQTIKEESSRKAGLSLSASYGPFVSASGSVEGATARSKQRALKAASSFAKDVTEKSATKIAERVLQRESRRVTTETEETNTHSLDNTQGSEHVVGVYQWVEKLYEAQIFNYGIRAMYDFMVPEPAAFLIAAMKRGHMSAVELEKPAPFDADPTLLEHGLDGEFNYIRYAQQYGATDILPPPQIHRTKSFSYSVGGGDRNTNYVHSAQIQLDEGYKAVKATVNVHGNAWTTDRSVRSIDIAIGRHQVRSEVTNWSRDVDLNNETESVPFTLDTRNMSQVAVAVEIETERTEHALRQWQLDTHAKITQAYRARLAEYEEKLAALQAQAGVAIEGQSPRLNQQLMQDELKKACVTILTEQHFDLFDAIEEEGRNGLPQIDLYQNEAEGPYVRFFEQAFEWEHMTWVTYPYFWGRKSEWPMRIALEDSDPMFNDFLKAGYCRVSVPVREGFEGAVDHFINFGEPWMGGPLPAITSPLFLPIADELAERLEKPGDEFPEGEPWEVRLPTSLVKLRADNSLPAWSRDANGDWIQQ